MNRLGILTEMTLEEVTAFRTEVVVIPLTSVEPHGPHLPYGTDLFIGESIARDAVLRANRDGARALLYPALPVGNNVNFKAFPLACRVRVRTYMNVLLDIIEALEEDGIRKIILANSHGGNVDTVRAVQREHFERHAPGSAQRAFVGYCSGIGLVDPAVATCLEHRSDHAGESETSLILHFRPELVRPGKLAAFPTGKPTLPSLQEGLLHFVRPWEAYMPTSAGGETRKSSAEKGSLLANSAAERFARVLVELSQAPWSERFPY